jgi:hypothetical protein
VTCQGMTGCKQADSRGNQTPSAELCLPESHDMVPAAANQFLARFRRGEHKDFITRGARLMPPRTSEVD